MIIAIIIIGLFSFFSVVVSIRVERKLINNSIYSRSVERRIERIENKICNKENEHGSDN